MIKFDFLGAKIVKKYIQSLFFSSKNLYKCSKMIIITSI